MYNYLERAKITNSETCFYDTNAFYSVTWPENGNFQGWDEYKDIHTFGVWNGVLFGTSFGGNCYFSHSSLLPQISGEDYYIIKLQMKLSPRSTSYVKYGKIMWVRDGDLVWNDDKSIEFEVYMDSKWHLYEINVGPKQWWQGNIRNLRIFPFVNSRSGDRFFIRSLEIISPDKFYCSNPSCSFFPNYSHPCAGCGSRGYCESESISANSFEITNNNDELIVNIDNYGNQVLKLDHGVYDKSGLVSNINHQLSRIDIGGYVFAYSEFNVDRLRIYSGTYSSDSSVEVLYSQLAEDLGFFSDGVFVGRLCTGSDSASGFEFKASYRLRSVDIQKLVSSDNADIYHNPSRFEVEAGRVDWNLEGSVFFDDKIKYTDYDIFEPEPFSGDGITVIDLTHPFNNEGKITKVFVAGRISSGKEAKFKVFRPFMDGTIKLVYEKSFGKEGSDVYTKRHDAYEIDVDFRVKKGDYVGFYNIELILGNVSTYFPDAIYCKFNKDVVGTVNIENVENKGNLGLCYYVRGDRKLDLISLQIDFGDRINISKVIFEGEEDASDFEYNVAICKDYKWQVNLFNGNHNHIICPPNSMYCYFVTHQNIAYGIEALNDSKVLAYNGIAGNNWGRDSNGMWTSGYHSYFYVNGDGEWLKGDPGEYPGDYSVSEPMNFEHDPIEFVLSFKDEIPIYKTKIYFKERENFLNFSWSYYLGSTAFWGNSDDPKFSYIPEYKKVCLDLKEFLPDENDDISEILFDNPTSLVWEGVYQNNKKVLVEDDSNFGSYALEWNIISHEFDPIFTKAIRLFTNYHKSTKICEIEAYSKVSNEPSLLDDVFLSYSREGDYWKFSTLEQDSANNTKVFATINDNPRLLNVGIQSSSVLRIHNISIEFDDDVVLIDDYYCGSEVFLDNVYRGGSSSITKVKVTNNFDVESNLSIDIPDDKVYGGTILKSKLSSINDIVNPEIGPGGILHKNEDYILKNLDRNIAINCDCYALNNLANGADIWFNYHPGSEYDLHLNGRSTVFPNDLRFTGSDGVTKLDYCITHIENGVAHVWVKVEDDLDSDTFIYLYYGANTTSSESDGNKVFEFFDDFSSAELDSSKWQYLTGYIRRRNENDWADTVDRTIFSNKVISLEKDFLRYGSIGIETKNTFDISKYCFGARIRTNNYTSDIGVGLFNYKGSSSTGDGNGVINTSYNFAWKAPNDLNGTKIINRDKEWHLVQIFHTKFAKLDLYTPITTGFTGPSSLNNRLVIASVIGYGGGTNSNHASFSIDYAFVRKCVYPEPSINSIGVEEEYSSGLTWLTGWKYRRKINISGVSGAGAGYPIYLRIRLANYSIWGLYDTYNENVGLDCNFKTQISKLFFCPVAAKYFKFVPDKQTNFSSVVDIDVSANGESVTPLFVKATSLEVFDPNVWDLSSISFSDPSSNYSFSNGNLTFSLASNEECEFVIKSKFFIDKFPNINIAFDLDVNESTDLLDIGLGVISEDSSKFYGIRKVNSSSGQEYSYVRNSWTDELGSTNKNQSSGKFRINKYISDSNSYNTFRDIIKYYYYDSGWITGYTRVEFENSSLRYQIELRVKKSSSYPAVKIIFSDLNVSNSRFYSDNLGTTDELSDKIVIKDSKFSFSGVSDCLYRFSEVDWKNGWYVWNDVFTVNNNTLETNFSGVGKASITSNGWYLPHTDFEINLDFSLENNNNPSSGTNRFQLILMGVSTGLANYIKVEWYRSHGSNNKFRVVAVTNGEEVVYNLYPSNFSSTSVFRVGVFNNEFVYRIKAGSSDFLSSYNLISITENVGFYVTMNFESADQSPPIRFKVKPHFIHRSLTHKSDLEIVFDSGKVLDCLTLFHYGIFNLCSVDVYISNDGVNYSFWQSITDDTIITESSYTKVALDLGKRYDLDFIRSYGPSPLLFFNESTVEFSNSDVGNAEDVVWGNSNKSDVRWFLIDIDPNTSSYIRKIGVYPNISTVVAPGGGKNSYWSYLGDVLTSFPVEENIALGATVSGSSYFSTMYPKYVVDGVVTDGFTTKVWGSDSNGSQWLKIYLDSIYDISKINLYFGFGENESDFMIEDYKIYFSDDDINYTEVTSVTGNSDYYRQHLYSNKRAKFVKLVISKYSAGKIEVEGDSSFEGAVVREIEIIKDTSTEQDYIDSEQYPVVAINNKEVFNINSIEFYKKDGWGSSYILWSKDSSNLRYSDFVTDDPSNVEFSSYGATFPNRLKWLAIKQNYAENCPSNGDEKRYLYKVKEFSSDVFRITQFPWWWYSNNALDREYLIKDSDTVNSIKVTTTSGIDQFQFIEGTNFGVDHYFSEMDFVSFNVYTVTSGLELRELRFGDYYGNRYHSWDLTDFNLTSGWNTIKLKWKDADLKAVPISIDYEDPESLLLNNYRDLTLKSFVLKYSCDKAMDFYLDDFKIRRNTFDEYINNNLGLYLCNNEYLEFPISEFSPRVGTVEFYLKPDYNFNGIDSFFESFSRTFFAFSDVAGDVFGFFILRGSGPAIAVGDSEFIKVKYVGYFSDVYFNMGDTVKVTLIWSNDGTHINSFGATAEIYINDILAASTMEKWEVKDNMFSKFILGGSISQRAAREKPTSIWGVVSDLRIYNYCKFPNVDQDLISPNSLIEVSLNGVDFYSKEDKELPFLIKKVQPGDSVTFFVKSVVPRFINPKVLRTPSVVVEWIRSF